MPKSPQFDPDLVMDKFLSVFWENGYGATTTKVLAESAGISESSLFNKFKNKREIYINVLRRYSETSLKIREKMEAEKTALLGIRNYWNSLGAMAKDPARDKGCLITNATAEQIQDPEIIKFLKSVHRGYDIAFQRTLDRAVKNGELRADTDTKALAQYLSHSAQGLRVLSKISPNSRKIDNIVEMTMSTLAHYQTQNNQAN
jgi:TetR/AcrR family transcriptional repressor of nem operon